MRRWRDPFLFFAKINVETSCFTFGSPEYTVKTCFGCFFFPPWFLSAYSVSQEWAENLSPAPLEAGGENDHSDEMLRRWINRCLIPTRYSPEATPAQAGQMPISTWGVIFMGEEKSETLRSSEFRIPFGVSNAEWLHLQPKDCRTEHTTFRCFRDRIVQFFWELQFCRHRKVFELKLWKRHSPDRM